MPEEFPTFHVESYFEKGAAEVSLSKDDRRVLSSVKERSGNAVDPAVLKRSGLRPAAFLQLQEASHPTIEATTAVGRCCSWSG